MSLQRENTELVPAILDIKGGIFLIFSLGGEGVGVQYFGRRQTLLCTLHM
jgi:hypothetical protein